MAEVDTAAEEAEAATVVAAASAEAAMEVVASVEAAVRATEAAATAAAPIAGRPMGRTGALAVTLLAATAAAPIAGRPMGRTRALAVTLLAATAAMDARVRWAAPQRPRRALALGLGIRRHRIQRRAVPALLRANGIRSAQLHLAETEQQHLHRPPGVLPQWRTTRVQAIRRLHQEPERPRRQRGARNLP